MSQEWYYSSKGERLGPVTAAELRKLADAGNLLATDFVWKEGMADWIEAKNIKGLFGAKSSGEVAKPTEPADAATPATQPEAVADDPPAPTTDSRPSGSRPGAVIERFNRDEPSRSRQRRFDAGDDDDDDRPRARGRDDDDDDRPRARGRDDDDDDRPRARGRRRDEEVDDYSPEDDYRDDFRPQRRGKSKSSAVKPGKVTAIAIMMLIGSIMGLIYTGSAVLASIFMCCLWPGVYYSIVVSILGIIRASALLGQNAYQQTPPSVISILMIICIINGDVVNCILGIICVVFCNDQEVKDYLAAK